MIYEDIQVSGSISISGSFNVPKHASTASANQATGSLFFDTSAKLFKVFQSGAGALNVASQPFTPTPPVAKGNIEYLAIGGGGSGGQLGGGGAGGHLSGSLANVTSGSSLTVTIGGGGAPITSVVRGNTGSDSSIAGTGYTTATALGGGGGGGQGGASDAGYGKDGGSGGGGGENDSGYNTPGSGTAGQGNDGGTGGTGAGTQLSGGGGGGAGAAGSNAAGQSSGGAGGNGLANNITGTSVTRAGGGGGGAWWYNNGGSSYGGAGGSGGGGAAGTTGNTAAVSGTANTGGGGGGAGFTSAGYWITDSGTGGSGVVILAYNSSSINAAGGIVGDQGNGRKYHQFNSTDTFKVGLSTDFQIVSDNLLLHFDAGDFRSRGTSTITDISTNTNNGTVSGATLGQNWWYDFDGSNDYITAPPTSYVSSGYSVEFWVYKDDINNSYDCIYAAGYGLQFYWRSNFIEMYLSTTDGGSYEVNSVQITGLSATTWVHAVITDDGSGNVVMYKDGAQSTTTTYSGTPYVYTGTPRIGDYAPSASSYQFDGRISQFRLYSDVLTASEVLQNYNATKTNFI